MCYYCDHKSERAKIAKEDIICWKNLRNKIARGKDAGSYPAFLHDEYHYRIGVLNPKIKLEKDNFEIYEGYHSFIEKSTALHHCGVTHKFIIPKGTRYYSNTDCGDMVSEQIIMVK